LIVNPSSGRGRARKLVPRLRELLPMAEIVESRSQQDLVDLAERATIDGYDIVASVGGDGTVHYVLTGIYRGRQLGNHAALGIIPLGRGNDIARTLEIPEDLAAACRVLLAGKTKLIDVASTEKNIYAGV